MRFGPFLAASSVAVASACAVASTYSAAAAQDGPTGPADPAARRVSYFSRSGQTGAPAGQPAARPNPTGLPVPVEGIPNYYGPLFGTAAEPTATTPPTVGMPTAGSPVAGYSSNRLPATAASGYRPSADIAAGAPAAMSDPAVQTASVEDATGGTLTHARYDRQPGSPLDGDIRQVGGLFQPLRRNNDAGPPARPAAVPNRVAGPSLPAGPRLSANPNPYATRPTGDPLGGDPFAGNPFAPTAAVAPASATESPADIAPSLAAEPSALTAPAVPANRGPAALPTALPAATAPAEPAPVEMIPVEMIPVEKAPVEKAPAPAATSIFAGPAPRVTVTPRSNSPEQRGAAKVEVRWERKSEVNVGRECQCELVVTNAGDGPAGDVAVEAFFPRSVRLVSAEPKPTTADDHLTWTMSTLAAGAEKRIAVAMIPNEQGELQVSAFVRFTEATAATFTVREPKLLLTLTGPSTVAIGEAASQTITVSNPGTGTAENVVVEAILPPGLEHARGGKLSMNVGSLPGGESQVIRLALVAVQGGPQAMQVRAVAGDLRQEASATVVVAAPNLKVVAEGPGLRYIGRDATYRVRVTNDGGAAANNVRVACAVSEGFRFVRADKGGRFESDASQILWYVGRIEAGQSIDLATELNPTRLGRFQQKMTVVGEQGVKAEAVVSTEVDGTASLLVEIVDLDDPVEVGVETAYEIRVKNEGTKAAKNVDIVCRIPAGVTLVSAKGPTSFRDEGPTLAFDPVEELAPGKAALYRVIVRGTAAGDHRFQVRLASDSITEPLIHEELTHFYAD